MNDRPIRPRDAATLIIHRATRNGIEVLMGRRHDSHVFAPGRYVFPGGRVDRSDRFVQPAADLRPEVAARLQRTVSEGRARAIAAAAVRETFEETGLVLGHPAATSLPAPKGWEEFLAQGMAPALDTLDYVFRAITPTGRPRRFNARFFLADARHVSGNIRPSGELDNIGWFPVSKVADLSTIGVTNWALSEAMKVLDAPNERNRPIPVVYMRGGKRYRTEE
jgi:8-oxo-dGTP pyrophosphatase MutT (NUDIX family)